MCIAFYFTFDSEIWKDITHDIWNIISIMQSTTQIIIRDFHSSIKYVRKVYPILETISWSCVDTLGNWLEGLRKGAKREAT